MKDHPGPISEQMVWIPSGTYLYKSSHRTREGEFILYNEGPRLLRMSGFYIDPYEVTNAEFKAFLDATGYRPADPHNFLRGWQGTYPEHLGRFPVTWVSREDAVAYASWVGKRLPNNIEWQRAAQGDDGRSWPWGEQFDPARCNSETPGATPVDAFPTGASPYGVYDLAGNVWEWTDPVISDGWQRWCLLRGGSYYQPQDSLWYAEGGAQPVYHTHKFLLMAPGLDRCGTVGFRCVYSEAITVLEELPLQGYGDVKHG